MTDKSTPKTGELAIAGCSRREVIKGAGAAVTLGALASAFGAMLPRHARAQASAANANCMTIVYPAGEGLKFDADYYRDKHIPLVKSVYGKNIERIELRTVTPPPEGRPPVPFAALVNIWFAQPADLSGVTEQDRQKLSEDIARFTNAQPVMQFDSVLAETGAARSEMKVGDGVFAILYPSGEGVRFNIERYASGHMPLIMRLYGTKAIKRFEVRKGESGLVPETGPTYLGNMSLYINDAEAFAEAGRKHRKEMADDLPHFSNITPTVFNTIIHAIG